MQFEQLYNLVTPTDAVIEESFKSLLRNTKILVAAGLILGIVDYGYSIPKLRQMVRKALHHSTHAEIARIENEIYKRIDDPQVKTILDKIENPPEIRTPRTVVSDDMLIHDVYEHIKQNEGVRYKMYKDVYGNWTIGIGHLVLPKEFLQFKDKTLSEAEVQQLFRVDVSKKIKMVRRTFGDKFDTFSEELKKVIIDGYFRGDLSGSPKTISLIKQGRFQDAAREYLNNAEYVRAKESGSGVARRMAQNARIIFNTKL